jgi:hypothetical protein
LSGLSAGLASLAVSAPLILALPNSAAYPNQWAIQFYLSIAFLVLGMALIGASLVRTVPVADAEASWNAEYDRLRNMTHTFMTRVIAANDSLKDGFPNRRESWESYVAHVPMLIPPAHALERWYDPLVAYHSEDVKLFFRLADMLEGSSENADYRRYAVRTYDRFWRLRAAKPGFRKWMEDEAVADGAEGLVVLLAYMEVARASRVKLGAAASHGGFWRLAQEWHPNVIALPRHKDG